MKKTNASIVQLTMLLLFHPVAVQEADFSGKWPNLPVFGRLDISQACED